MASPITWRNVNSNFDVRGAAKLMDSAGANINSAFSGLGNILKNAQGIQDTNRQTQIDTATNEFLNKLQGMSPEELQAARQDGTIAAMRDSYGATGLDRDKTNAAAVSNLLSGLQKNAVANQQYLDQQAEIGARGDIANFYDRLYAEDAQGALAAAQNVPAQFRSKLMGELDKFQDEQGQVSLANQGAAALASRDLAGIDQAIEAGKASGRDVSGLIAQRRQIQQGLAKDNIISTVKGLGGQLQQGLKDNQQKALTLAQELGIPVKNGSVDYSGTNDVDAIKQHQAALQAMQAPNLGRLIEQNVNPLLQQYNSDFGFDGTGNEVALLQQSIKQPGEISDYDRQIITQGKNQQLQDLKVGGNMYAQDDHQVLNGANAFDVLQDVVNSSPSYKNDDGKVDADAARTAARELSDFVTDGIQIGNEKIKVPVGIVKLALAESRSSLVGNALEDRVRDLMEKNGVAEQYKAIQDIDTWESKQVSNIQRANGYVSPDFIPGLRNNANARIQELSAQEDKRIALNEALKKHKAGQVNDNILVDEPLDRFRVASGAFDFSPIVLPERVESRLPVNSTPVTKIPVPESLQKVLEKQSPEQRRKEQELVLKRLREAARS